MRLKNSWDKKYEDSFGLKASKKEIRFSKVVNKLNKPKNKKYKNDKKED